MVIKNKSRSYIIDTLIKKKYPEKGLKIVRSDVTEKQEHQSNDERLNVKLKAYDVNHNTSSSSGTTSKDKHASNTKQKSRSIEISQRKASLLKRIAKAPKSSVQNKCKEDDTIELSTLKPSNSFSTLSTGASRREKMSKAIKTFDSHRRRNKSLRDGEILSKSSIDSRQDILSSSFASFPNSATPSSKLPDLSRVSENHKKIPDVTNKGNAQSAKLKKNDDSGMNQNIFQVRTLKSRHTAECKRDDIISKKSEIYHNNSNYSSFLRNPRSASSDTSRGTEGSPKVDEYSVKRGEIFVVSSAGKPICGSREETIGSAHKNVHAHQGKTIITISSKKSKESLGTEGSPKDDEYSVQGGKVSVDSSAGKPICCHREKAIATKDKMSSHKGNDSRPMPEKRVPSHDLQCVDVMTTTMNKTHSFVSKSESVNSVTKLRFKDENVVSTSVLNSPSTTQSETNKVYDGKETSSKGLLSEESKKLLVNTKVSKTKTANSRDTFCTRASSNGSEKSPIKEKFVPCPALKSPLQKVVIDDSGSGFANEFKTYPVHNDALTQDLFTVLHHSDYTHNTTHSRSYSNTCKESRRLDPLFTVSNSGYCDDKKDLSWSKTASKSFGENKASISFNDSGTSYSASYDDFVTSYDDASRSVYSHGPPEGNQKFSSSPWWCWCS